MLGCRLPAGDPGRSGPPSVRHGRSSILGPDSWRGRRVFLTGHTGFKGAWLALWLERLGAETTGYALAPATEPSLFELARVAHGLDSILADVRDAERLERELAASRAEVVFHLAAQALVRPSYRDPVGTLATNVMGTAHLLDAVRRVDTVRAVVVVTSDKCYENREDGRPLVEDDPLGGRDPYSASKAAAEIVARAWRDSFLAAGDGRRVAVATARAGNVLGGGDWSEDRVVPDTLRALAERRAVELRHPAAVRPWQHVLEPLSGYLALAERLLEDGESFAGAWNFAPRETDAWPVGRLVASLYAAWGETFRWQEQGGPRPHEAGLLRLDAGRARRRLGWRPRWAVDETVTRLVAWHRALEGGADARTLALAEIADYEGAA